MQCVCVTVCLRYALESDAVRPLRTPRSPMDRACKAPLMTLGEEELARHLLLQTLPRDVAVRKIIIQKLRYRDEDLCTIVSEGVDPLFAAIEVRSAVEVKAKKHKKDKKAHHDRDFLHLLPKSAATAGGHPGPSAASGLGQDHVGCADIDIDIEALCLEDLTMPANELINDLFGVLEDDVARTLEEAAAAMAAEMQEEEEDESAESEADNASTSSSDGTPAPPAPPADSAAASDAAPADAAEDRFAHLPIRELAPWRFVFRVGSGAGFIHQISVTSLKATCQGRKHKSCVWWLSNVHDVGKAEQDLAAWIADASPDRAGHQEAARLLNMAYGMQAK